jgi:hypothetical protein
VRRWLDRRFTGHWTGSRGPVDWPPRSLEFTLLDFYLWGHLNAMVYQVKIQKMGHLKERFSDACAHDTRRVKASWPRVGEMHPYVLSV